MSKIKLKNLMDKRTTKKEAKDYKPDSKKAGSESYKTTNRPKTVAHKGRSTGTKPTENVKAPTPKGSRKNNQGGTQGPSRSSAVVTKKQNVEQIEGKKKDSAKKEDVEETEPKAEKREERSEKTSEARMREKEAAGNSKKRELNAILAGEQNYID